ncbi:hypothetical protein [Tenggerimyces flavus]|uniref:Uncharacterized protein n=1 Tax=Tenggerimyces flavus TaxID=1708749 RepID=A0ABV7YM36_9ACTN|nr:hypothetical protein [Tenggerimyces flavus]MBM7787504.1 hypothetical protein [Tenggerimyces flavus]
MFCWALVLAVALRQHRQHRPQTSSTLLLSIARFWLPIIPAVCLGGVGALYLLARQEARRYPFLITRAAGIAACLVLLGTFGNTPVLPPRWERVFESSHRGIQVFRVP